MGFFDVTTTMEEIKLKADSHEMRLRLRQKCAERNNRKFPISAEMQLSATATRVKHSSCESAGAGGCRSSFSFLHFVYR